MRTKAASFIKLHETCSIESSSLYFLYLNALMLKQKNYFNLQLFLPNVKVNVWPSVWYAHHTGQ